jgi:NAD(P)H-quinone oxidoreductase subunit 4
VAPRESLPALALAVAVVAIGLVPALLGHLSELSLTALSQAAIATATPMAGGLG